MKMKSTFRQALKGLLAAVLAISMPVAALAAPQAGDLQMTERHEAVASNYTALEIFAQEQHALSPRTVAVNNTAADPSVPAGTAVLFVIGGVATQVNAGEWQIGNPPVYVYESADTIKSGTPAAGDEVRVVGKRTVASGPIIAQYITMTAAAPQAPAPPIVSTAYLFNGTAGVVTGTTWTVAPPAPDPAVNFSILAAGGAGPTTIVPGLGSASAVTVEFIVNHSNNPATFDALEIFAQEQNVVAAGAPVSDSTPVAAGLPADTTVLFVIGGVATEVNAVTGEWKVGNPPVYVYENAQTTRIGAPTAGDEVRVVGKRTLSPGPIVAQYITRIAAGQAAIAPVVSTAYLYNGTVGALNGNSWAVGSVTFNVLRDAGAAGIGPTTIQPGLVSGSAATVEFVVEAVPPNLPPEVMTEPADAVNLNGATLHGNLGDPGTSAAVQVYFVYGPTTSYGSQVMVPRMTAAGPFSVTLSGLLPATTYHYRAKANGDPGLSDSGADMTFTTGVITAPTVFTASASGLATTSATLNGNLTALGSAASVDVSFEWGATSGGPYPNATAVQTRMSTGTFFANVSGLTSGTAYFFRAKANGGASGISYGDQGSFVALTSTSGGDGGTSGGGGTSGSSGSGSGETKTVTMTGLTSDDPLKVDNSGKSQNTVRLSNSGPGKPSIEIPAGTMMKTSTGAALTTITIAPPATTPPAPPQNTVVLAQDMGPDGATFQPPISLTMAFDPASLPAGASESDLAMAWWDGAKWVYLLTTVDAVNNTLTAKVNHFTVFGVLAKAAAVTAPPPATTPPAETTSPPTPPVTTPVEPPVTTPAEPPSTPATTPPATTTPVPPASEPVTDAASGFNFTLLVWAVVAVLMVVAVVIAVRRRQS